MINLNDFTIITRKENGIRYFYVSLNNEDLTEKGKYGPYNYHKFQTKSKAYEDLGKEIIQVDTSKLNSNQLRYITQSIESAVKNATNKKDKDLDVSEFDFDKLLKEDNKEKDIDDFNFEELDEFEEFGEKSFNFDDADTNKEFLEEIKDRENQIKLIDKKIQSELDFFVEVRLDIAKAEKTISDLNELLAERKEVLNQHMEDKVQLRLDIEDFKTCLKYTK